MSACRKLRLLPKDGQSGRSELARGVQGGEPFNESPCQRLPLNSVGRSATRIAIARAVPPSDEFRDSLLIVSVRPAKAPTENNQRKDHNHHTATTFCPRFSTKGSRLRRPNPARIRPENRNGPPNNQELTTTHHNSPQRPKTSLFHNQLVRPQLLTSVPPRNPGRISD